MQLHKLACIFMSWYAVPWACMQLLELSWSSMSLHEYPWACMQFLSLSEQLTRISQCLFCDKCHKTEGEGGKVLERFHVKKKKLVSKSFLSHLTLSCCVLHIFNICQAPTQLHLHFISTPSQLTPPRVKFELCLMISLYIYLFLRTLGNLEWTGFLVFQSQGSVWLLF